MAVNRIPSQEEREALRRRRQESYEADRRWCAIRDKDTEVLQVATDAILNDPATRPRDKILFQMRANEEAGSRFRSHRVSGYIAADIFFPYSRGSAFDRVSIAKNCFNKSVAVYYFDDKKPSNGSPRSMGVETWLYRQWFKPYETDIEFGRCLAQIINLAYERDMVIPSEISLDQVIGLHCDMIEQSQRFIDVQVDGVAGNRSSRISGPLRGVPWTTSLYDRPEKWYEQGYNTTRAIQPIFRALFMVLIWLPEYYAGGFADFRVRLILTGITEGLSAPISFNKLHDVCVDPSYQPGDSSLVTTFENATKFIMEIEQRERAVFGIQPSLDEVNKQPSLRHLFRHYDEAKKLGWDEERDGKLDELSPYSSQWVDRAIFPTWIGQGPLYWIRCALIRRTYCNLTETTDWFCDP
ncbi:hypothetical protein F5Y18DRAFT_436404 [Xylariaceae sp. FL1019]|nr:hypothetical protein F5Y18DRAFT_436404 [Xylariaceae sp. FL1019]